MIGTGEKLWVGGMGASSLGGFSSWRGISEGSRVPSLPDTSGSCSAHFCVMIVWSSTRKGIRAGVCVITVTDILPNLSCLS